MIAFLQYIAALILLQAAGGADVRKAPDGLAIVATILGFAVAARVLGLVIARRDDDQGAVESRGPLRALLVATDVGRVASLAVFWAITVPLGGARLPEAIGVGDWPIVARLVQFAPFLALVGALPWGLFPAAAALGLGARSAARAVLAEYRDAVLPAAPVVLTVGLEALRGLAVSTNAAGRALIALFTSPAMFAFAMLGLLLGMLLLMPFVMRVVIGAKPLPAGPLRQRLEAYSRRVGFRARDILVWRTEADVINAVVVGAFPRFRYAIVTDGLLKTLKEDEIEAVFAHEAGHARRGHVLLFLGFTAILALVGFVPGLNRLFGATLAQMSPLMQALVLVGLWFGVVMGWISRRFEQEADVFGIETLPMSDPADPTTHPFARALTRIGEEVGAIREMHGWRHFSIDERLKFVRAYLTDPDVRRAHRRSLAILRGTLMLVVGGFALAAAAQIPGEIVRARDALKQAADPQAMLLQSLNAALEAPDVRKRAAALRDAGLEAARAGRDEDAARLLRESTALDPSDSGALIFYGALLAKTGRPLGARLVWRTLATRDDVGADAREAFRKMADAPAPR